MQKLTIKNLIPTIICGGVGSRLWPLSREQHPKPFIKPNHDNSNSLLQSTYLRALHFATESTQTVITVTNKELFFKVIDEYEEVTNQSITNNIILEPFGQNTAPAIALACLKATAINENAILLVLPADHLIHNLESFYDAVSEACNLAEQDKIVTFGINPSNPATGYGYIEADGYEVIRFVEKPNLEAATEYFESGKFYWNSGMFCFKVSAMLNAMQQHCPELLSKCTDSFNNGIAASGKNFIRLDIKDDDFREVPSISIDYAIMEKISNCAIVPCDIGWDDIGCFNSLGNLTKADNNDNRLQGNVIVHDSNSCTVLSDERTVGIVGLENLVIIDTPDALLVANKNKTQDVKNIYSYLQQQGHESHKVHKVVKRPWGSYHVLDDGSDFKVKRIEVKPGHSLSLQRHKHRGEHWLVISGTAIVVNASEESILKRNDTIHIPCGNIHRLSNPGTEPLVIIEVQLGNILDENDIERLEDVYNRK